MSEKRRDRRLSIELPVILRHGGRIIPATVRNISSGGVYLSVGRSKIETERPVEIIFDLSDASRDVSMRGRIMRVEDSNEQSGLGVQFTNLFSQSHKAIDAYVKERLH